MKRKIVLRLKWYIKKSFIDEENIDEIKKSIDCLIKYHIASLVNQINQDYICFIEYQPKVEEILFKKIQESKIIIPSNIVFTREIRLEIRKMFTIESMEMYSKILFVRVNQDQIYEKTFIDKLHQCNLPETIRVIKFKEAYRYYFEINRLYENIGNGEGCINYAYICSLEEYFKHFCIYDYYFPEVLERNYDKMPNIYLENKVLLSLEKNTKVKKVEQEVKNIQNSDVALIIRNFVKEGSDKA